MKIFTGCLSFIMLLSVLSCENQELQKSFISENEALIQLFSVKETTESMGVFNRFGAEKLIVENSPNSSFYRLIGGSILRVKSKDYPISSLVFQVKGGKYFLQGNESDFISFAEGKTKITISGKTIDLENYEYNTNSAEVDLLLLGFLELTTPIEQRNRASKPLESHRIQCSFWGTYYLASINTDKSTALEELKNAIESENSNSGCTKMGEVTTSCFWDSQFCLATQAYCCDN